MPDGDSNNVCKFCRTDTHVRACTHEQTSFLLLFSAIIKKVKISLYKVHVKLLSPLGNEQSWLKNSGRVCVVLVGADDACSDVISVYLTMFAHFVAAHSDKVLARPLVNAPAVSLKM